MLRGNEMLSLPNVCRAAAIAAALLLPLVHAGGASAQVWLKGVACSGVESNRITGSSGRRSDPFARRGAQANTQRPTPNPA